LIVANDKHVFGVWAFPSPWRRTVVPSRQAIPTRSKSNLR